MRRRRREEEEEEDRHGGGGGEAGAVGRPVGASVDDLKDDRLRGHTNTRTPAE